LAFSLGVILREDSPMAALEKQTGRSKDQLVHWDVRCRQFGRLIKEGGLEPDEIKKRKLLPRCERCITKLLLQDA
jgi:hypothetical protein